MIYADLLSGRYQALPRVLRDFHATPGERWASGSVTVRHQNGWLAWMIGFPRAGENVPLRLRVVARDDEEEWTRWFGAAMRRSVQRADGDVLMETAGPVRIGFRVTACETGMRFESRGARIWGIPIPLRIQATTRGGDTAWHVEVSVAHVGSYSGQMTPEP